MTEQRIAEPEVEVVTQATEAPVVEKPSPAPDPVIEDLRKKLEASNAEVENHKKAREEADKRAAETQRQIATEVGNRVRADEVAIANALVAAESDKERAKAEYASALERADYGAAADAQARMSDIALQVRDLTGKRQQIETWKSQQIAQANQRQQQPDPLAGFTPKTRDWIKAHPEIMTNPRLGTRAAAAAIEAEEKGLTQDSPEYFAFVDERMGYRQPAQAAQTESPLSQAAEVTGDEPDEEEVVVVEAPKPRPAPPKQSTAAPPSRAATANGGTPTRKNQITLTPGEKEIALRLTYLGNTEEERLRAYALQKQKLEKEGAFRAS